MPNFKPLKIATTFKTVDSLRLVVAVFMGLN